MASGAAMQEGRTTLPQPVGVCVGAWAALCLCFNTWLCSLLLFTVCVTCIPHLLFSPKQTEEPQNFCFKLCLLFLLFFSNHELGGGVHGPVGAAPGLPGGSRQSELSPGRHLPRGGLVASAEWDVKLKLSAFFLLSPRGGTVCGAV